MAWESAYAADHIDLLLRLKEVVIGQPLVTMPVRSGTGDGIVYGIHTTVSGTPIESWAVTCTNDIVPATFSVVGSVSGAQASATVGTDYSNSQISFRIVAGSVPFSAADNFVFSTQTNPLVAAVQTWTVNRWFGTGSKVINYLSSSTYDGSGSYNADKAADDSDSTFWGSDTSLGINSWWQVQFDKPIEILKLSLGGYPSNYLSYVPDSFSVSYSDDGTAWTVSNTFTGLTSWQPGEVRDFVITASGAHTYWRITILTLSFGVNLATLFRVTMHDVNGAFNVAKYGDGYEAILRGPGTAGGDNVFVSIRADAYVHNGPNWMVGGSVGYSSGLDAFEQPSNSTENFVDTPRLALYNQPMKYWFIVTGRRIMVFARFQNITAGSHLGFGLPYALPSQYPYPLLVAGSQSMTVVANRYGWDRVDGTHRLFINPGTSGGGFSNHDNTTSATRLFTPFNTWKQAANIHLDTTYSFPGVQALVVWPYQTDNQAGPNGNFVQQLDGKWPMSPVVFLDRVTQSSLCEVDGVKHLPGVHAVESLITYEGDTWVILNNVYRDSDGDFFAVRLS